MRIPATLVLLGEPIEIETGNGDTWYFPRNKFYLAATMDGRELWVLPYPEGRKIVHRIPTKAAGLFKRFTGWHPDKAFTFQVSDLFPKYFGKAVSIAYRSNKWTGNLVGYIHTFEFPPKIQVDSKENPGIWRIRSPKLKVEAVGITG
jgi:hypothetical protein